MTEEVVHLTTSRARTKVRVEQVGWVETAAAVVTDTLASLGPSGRGVAVDEARVARAMDPGWRYSEVEGVRPEHMLGALQTSAWFSLDSEALAGACAGADPEIDDLPPLPYKRIALDCGRPPLKFMQVEIASQETGRNLGRFYCPVVVVFEIEQGRQWDVLTNGYLRSYEDEIDYDYAGGPLFGYHLTPGGHTADYAFLSSIKGWNEGQITLDRHIGQALWKTVVTAVHMIDASNVVYTRLAPGRKQRRDWARKPYRYREPQIYRVDIVSYTGPQKESSGKREYHVRWMVRGHYRHSEHGEFIHPRTGLPAIRVKSHIKGPADAPWKGRPAYRMPTDKEG